MISPVKLVTKLISTFTPLFVFLLLLAVITLGTSLNNKAKAGVYVTDQVDAVSAFCQAVVTTKDMYCPRVRIDCRQINKKKIATFMANARKCVTDPGTIKEADAAKLMETFQQNQSTLCCMPLTLGKTPKPKASKKKEKPTEEKPAEETSGPLSGS